MNVLKTSQLCVCSKNSKALFLCPISCKNIIRQQQRPLTEDVSFLDLSSGSSVKRGRGGRSSFSGVVATVFGASGFIGNSLCNQLGKSGTQLILPYRADIYHIRRLKLMGDLGQVLFQPYHLLDDESIRKAVKHSNVVINLVGRDWDTRNFTLNQVNVEGAERIARISKEMGVERFVQISALNSNVAHPGYLMSGGSEFLRTKGEGEKAVRSIYPDATVFRPSDVWGQGDRFVQYLNKSFRFTGRAIPLPYSGEGVWKQPVYVGDLTRAIVVAVYDKSTAGQIFEAVGPRRYELSELVDWFLRITRRDTLGYSRSDLVFYPWHFVKCKLNSFNPSTPVHFCTLDKVEREAVTDRTTGLPTLRDLGVALTTMEERMIWELKMYKVGDHYSEEVGEFENPAPPAYQTATS